MASPTTVLRRHASDVTCLFAGALLDRAAAFSDLQRSSPQYAHTVITHPRTRFLVFHGTKPLVLRCNVAAARTGTATLARVSADTLARSGVSTESLLRFHERGVDAGASASAGTATGGSAASSTPSEPGSDEVKAVHNVVLGMEGERPLCAVDMADAVPAADEALSRVRDALDLSCSGRYCALGADCKGGKAEAQFSDGRELLFGPALMGSISSIDTSAPVPDAAARYKLQPHEMAWPLPFEDVSLLGLGKALLTWSMRNRFCGSCGSPMLPSDGGVKMKCSRTGCGDTVYPRTDPVVISLVQSRDGSRVLMGRQPVFPPSFYSCLAGYLESGESIEEAVRREVYEETRVRVGPVRYYASQPWPLGRGTFAQLMIGCLATAENDDDASVVMDKEELEDARWMDRAAVAKCIQWYYRDAAGAPAATEPRPARPTKADAPRTSTSPTGMKSVPGPFAIAHQLLKAWLDGKAADLLPHSSAAGIDGTTAAAKL